MHAKTINRRSPAARRGTLALLVAGSAAALASGAVMPAAAGADTPQNRVLQLRDQCEATSFNAVFGPGFCTRTGSGVSWDRFSADLLQGGSGAWWIHQRDLTIDKGDTVTAQNVGGIFHSFTEVKSFGKGCIPQFNVAVTETVDNCDFGTFLATAVPQGPRRRRRRCPWGCTSSSASSTPG